jgi:hypothetical protein
MQERAIDRRRRREADRTAPAPPQPTTDPVLALQRSAGNAAVAQMLARTPAAKGATGTVKIGGVGEIRVSGGNLDEWTGKGAPDDVEVTSETGKHSAKLEKLASARTRTDVKVTIAPAAKEGEHLDVGAGTVLDIGGARVKGYAVEDGVETWRLVDFETVKRTKISHKVAPPA